jgi:hypothetical protein
LSQAVAILPQGRRIRPKIGLCGETRAARKPFTIVLSCHQTDGAPMKTDFTQELPGDWLPIARVFAALGDPWRQKILLLFEENEELFRACKFIYLL